MFAGISERSLVKQGINKKKKTVIETTRWKNATQCWIQGTFELPPSAFPTSCQGGWCEFPPQCVGRYSLTSKIRPPAFSRKYWIATVRRWNGWYTLSGLLVIIMSVCVRIGVCVGARFLVDGWQLWTVCGFRSGQLISLDLPPKSMLVLPLSSSQIFVGVNTLEPIHKHDSYAWQEKLIPILTLCRSHHHWHEFGVSQNF